MEGFGLPPLEAMSSGVSVVTSRVGAVSDYMNDSSGIIINPESPSIIWINAILQVSRHKLIRDQFSVNARQGAENFSWSQTSNLYLNLMDRLESSR
jgi:glycosyltransferase involved in cell wall biosynthesis